MPVHALRHLNGNVLKHLLLQNHRLDLLVQQGDTVEKFSKSTFRYHRQLGIRFLC